MALHTPPNRRAARVVHRILTPVDQFLKTESSSGILLMITACIAMGWANSPWSDVYEHFIHTPIGFTIGGIDLVKSLGHWVNDGLMVIFFFVVGLVITENLSLESFLHLVKLPFPFLRP